jgi:hypothetical protein
MVQFPPCLAPYQEDDDAVVEILGVEEEAAD